jgi:hypothetical protein
MSNERLWHWKSVRRSKANPDLMNHADLFHQEKSAKAGRDIFGEVVVKIERVTIGLVKSKEQPNGEQMICLHFEGKKKKLGLNSGHCQVLEALTGRGTPPSWVGTSITLYVDPKAKYPGRDKFGPAIRIRPTLPTTAADTAPLPDVPEEARERLEGEQLEKLGEREPGEEG